MCKNCESKITDKKVTAKKPSRPICLEIEDARTEVFKTISYIADKYHLPCFLMEDMFRDAWQRVSQLAEQERERAQKLYEEQLKEGEWET